MGTGPNEKREVRSEASRIVGSLGSVYLMPYREVGRSELDSGSLKH